LKEGKKKIPNNKRRYNERIKGTSRLVASEEVAQMEKWAKYQSIRL